MNILAVIPIDKDNCVLTDVTAGVQYKLDRQAMLMLASQLLAQVAPMGIRIVANAQTPLPVPTQPTQPPFVPGPVDPNNSTAAWIAYLQSLQNKPPAPPVPPPAPQSSGGSTTIGGDSRR